MTSLQAELERLIALEGPITVELYMALCLGHPVHGYYRTRDPLGAGGDFTTAPEVSQMFGELIGLWAVEVWQLMGAPDPVRVVEFGPGRGTLMADFLRAARIAPSFRAAIRVDLVETSPVLRQRQHETLDRQAVPLAWHERLADIPDGPAIVIANEFFDALPARQFAATEDGWRERLVGLGRQGLAFGLAPEPSPEITRPARPGAVLEVQPAALDLVGQLARRLAGNGGAALIIDYGYTAPALGDTLQAVKAHAFADPLAAPGEADLTVHVDFAALARAAGQAGAAVLGPATQGDFLAALGLDLRAAALAARATPAVAQDIEGARRRLTEAGPTGMGELFKILGLADPRLPGLPALRGPAKPLRPNLAPPSASTDGRNASHG